MTLIKSKQTQNSKRLKEDKYTLPIKSFALLKMKMSKLNEEDRFWHQTNQFGNMIIFMLL